jgi:hypothetical protein
MYQIHSTSDKLLSNGEKLSLDKETKYGMSTGMGVENPEYMDFPAFKELHNHRMNETLIHSDFWNPENGNLDENDKYGYS